MKKYENEFSKLTNQLFYVKVEDENGNNSYPREESILYKVGYDDKVILILHELFLGTNFRRECLLSLDYLIEKCGYKADKDNRKSFKNTLEKLKEIELINFELINKSNELLVIDTDGLMVMLNGNYTLLSDEELETFNKIIDVRKRTTLLKLYLYLKARTTKRKDGEDINMHCRPQVTYQKYETINEYTNISESRIKEYIDQLQEMKLIVYRNVGKRYKETDKHQKLTEAPNVYAICNLQDDIEAELELGIKQCKYDQEKQGYVIVDRDYKNNNRKINGKKGNLTKKINNGTITEEEQKQYDDIIAMENEYKEEYNNFGNTPKKKEIWGEEQKEDTNYSNNRFKELRNKNIDPFTNKPYKMKKYTTYEEEEDYMDKVVSIETKIF